MQVHFDRYQAIDIFESRIESNGPLFEALRQLDVDEFVATGDFKACLFVADLASYSHADLELAAHWLVTTFTKLPEARKTQFFEWATDEFFDECGQDLTKCLALDAAAATTVLHEVMKRRYEVIKRIDLFNKKSTVVEQPQPPVMSNTTSRDIARFFMTRFCAAGPSGPSREPPKVLSPKVHAAMFFADAVWAHNHRCLMGTELPYAFDDGAEYSGVLTEGDADPEFSPMVRDVLERVAQYLADKSDDEVRALCCAQPPWMFATAMAEISEAEMVGYYTRNTRLVSEILGGSQ